MESHEPQKCPVRNLQGIRTRRLWVRELREGDTIRLYEYRSDADVARYQSWRPASAKEVLRFIAANAEQQELAPGSWYQLAIATPDDVLVGDVGLHLLEDGQQMEIGITIAPAFQRHGLATEALTAIVDRIFSECRVHRICASIDPRNTPSIALVRRLGFRQEAHHRQSLFIRGEWTDDAIFAILAAEWQYHDKSVEREPR